MKCALLFSEETEARGRTRRQHRGSTYSIAMGRVVNGVCCVDRPGTAVRQSNERATRASRQRATAWPRAQRRECVGTSEYDEHRSAVRRRSYEQRAERVRIDQTPQRAPPALPRAGRAHRHSSGGVGLQSIVRNAMIPPGVARPSDRAKSIVKRDPRLASIYAVCQTSAFLADVDDAMSIRARDPRTTCAECAGSNGATAASQGEAVTGAWVRGHKLRDSIKQDSLCIHVGFSNQRGRSCVQGRLVPIRPAECTIE